MTIFSLLESFFFLFLGISFILVLLMVYHFKKKLDLIEKKNETLQDICKTICEELDFVKSQPKPQNIFYNDTPVVPNISELFKTIMVTDALDIQNYENEELDDVQNYDEEDFDYQETETTSSVEEVEDFSEEKQGFYDEVMVHVQKLDDFVRPMYDLYVVDSDSRVEEIEEIEEIEVKDEIEVKEEIEVKYEIEDKDEIHEIEIKEEIETKKEEEEIRVEKLLPEGEDEEVPLEYADTKATKAELQKFTLQMLRTMVIKEGLCTDPSKLKKNDLIQIVLDSQQ